MPNGIIIMLDGTWSTISQVSSTERVLSFSMRDWSQSSYLADCRASESLESLSVEMADGSIIEV